MKAKAKDDISISEMQYHDLSEKEEVYRIILDDKTEVNLTEKGSYLWFKMLWYDR